MKNLSRDARDITTSSKTSIFEFYKSSQFSSQASSVNNSPLWPLLMVCATNISTISACEDENELNKIWNDLKEGNIDSNEFAHSIATLMGSKTQNIIDTGVPGKLSYGFVCGFSSGYALKKVGKVAAFSLGIGFALLQSLSYGGYIKINFERMNEDFNKLMDLDNDDDFDQDDAQELLNRIYNVLSYNIPAGSGFGTGFFMGLRSG